jgi:hypothetical protein
LVFRFFAWKNFFWGAKLSVNKKF